MKIPTNPKLDQVRSELQSREYQTHLSNTDSLERLISQFQLDEEDAKLLAAFKANTLQGPLTRTELRKRSRLRAAQVRKSLGKLRVLGIISDDPTFRGYLVSENAQPISDPRAVAESVAEDLERIASKIREAFASSSTGLNSAETEHVALALFRLAFWNDGGVFIWLRVLFKLNSREFNKLLSLFWIR